MNPPDQNIDNYSGIAKVDVLAPEKLLHPLLPVKLNEKLLFPLCVRCVEDQAEHPWYERTNLCPHSDEQRMMTGTWCTPEIQKAVEKVTRSKKYMKYGTFLKTRERKVYLRRM